MEGPEFVGEETRENPLTGFSDPSRGVGRPFEIGDEKLMRAAQELQFVLEQNWGSVGVRLRDSKTLSDIRNAFCQVQYIQCSRLDLFKFPETRRATGKELRKLRKDLQVTRNRLYQASVSRRYAQDWLQKARRDCANENDETRKHDLEFACSEWLLKSNQADKDTAEVESDLTKITGQLTEGEAYFAQSEVLDFIRSGRREFTPFNVASAMAGIPYLSARVSCERVWAMKPRFTKGHAYLLFAAIRANFTEWPRDLARSIEHMRTYLLAANRNRLPHIKELRKNWYFLELAIRSTTREQRGPRGSLPYRVFAEYMGRFTCQQSGDSILAEKQRILIEDELPNFEDPSYRSN